MQERQLPGDSPRRGDAPRPTLRDLHQELSHGRNIHEIIGSVLQGDAQRMFAYHRGDLPRQLDEAMIELYDLRPSELEEAAEVISPADLDFVSGFSYIATQLYPSVIDSSKRLTGELPLFPPGFVQSQMTASEEERRRFAELVASTPQLRARISGEVLEDLRKDPSGVSWLQSRVREEFHDSGMELVGASHAVIGAGKLFDLLTR